MVSRPLPWEEQVAGEEEEGTEESSSVVGIVFESLLYKSLPLKDSEKNPVETSTHTCICVHRAASGAFTTRRDLDKPSQYLNVTTPHPFLFFKGWEK